MGFRSCLNSWHCQLHIIKGAVITLGSLSNFAPGKPIPHPDTKAIFDILLHFTLWSIRLVHFNMTALELAYIVLDKARVSLELATLYPNTGQHNELL